MASLKRRGSTFYIQFYHAGQQRRVSTETDCYQLAKEKLRQFESAQARGDELPLPSRTPIPDIVTAYVDHIRQAKTPKSAQTDLYYLRDIFGVVCDALKVTSRKLTPATKKRPKKEGQDRRVKEKYLQADCLERITTAEVATFIAGRMKGRGLAPKTANRYREILTRLINWAMDQRGVKMPGDKNPAARVERYTERAPEIRFLSLSQIDEQLNALADKPQMKAMIAVYVYAGLRREELLWLTVEDVDLSAKPCGLIRVRSKTVDGEFWQPKTKVNRVVPVSRALRAILDTYTPRVTAGRWMFPSPDGKRWDPDNFSADLRDVNASAKLPWGCLDFRHTFGSQLAMKGESLFKISTLMGNSPEICRRHYAALVPEEMTDSVEFAAAPADVAPSADVPT